MPSITTSCRDSGPSYFGSSFRGRPKFVFPGFPFFFINRSRLITSVNVVSSYVRPMGDHARPSLSVLLTAHKKGTPLITLLLKTYRCHTFQVVPFHRQSDPRYFPLPEIGTSLHLSLLKPRVSPFASSRTPRAHHPIFLMRPEPTALLKSMLFPLLPPSGTDPQRLLWPRFIIVRYRR